MRGVAPPRARCPQRARYRSSASWPTSDIWMSPLISHVSGYCECVPMANRSPLFGISSPQRACMRCSERCLRSRWTLAPSIGEVPSSSERAACIARNAEKFDNQKPRVASFLFVRRGTQSYDEFIAGVPLRPRLSMMLGMINTFDIFSIGENASACTSSGRRVT